MASIIDNRNKTMLDSLKNSLKQAESVDILTAFFYFSGFNALAEELKDKKIRILVGNTIDPSAIADLCNAVKDSPDELLETYAVRGYTRLNNSQKKNYYVDSFVELFNKSALADEFDSTDSQAIFKMFLDKIADGTLEIRLTATPNHAKAYILTNMFEYSCFGDQKGVVFTGSSNFTYNGLRGQGEMNERFSDNSKYEEYSESFEKLWNDSKSIDICVKDGNQDFINELKKKLWIFAKPTPYQIFIRILFELYASLESNVVKSPYEITDGKFSNLKYQLDAIKYGVDCINKNNGVIIADVVGLGKSVIASAIAHNLDMKRTVIIAPPHLVDQWNDYQQDFGLRGVRVCSSGKLEELYNTYAADPNPILYIIDEAHRYRNELSDAYQWLHQLTRSHADNKVVLLTATPYNNRPQDLFALIKLFQTPSRSTIHSVDNLGVRFHELIAQYNRLEKEGKKGLTSEIKYELDQLSQQLRILIDPVIVRRSRIDLQEIKEYADDLKVQGIQFPQVVGPELVEYDLGEIRPLYLHTLDLLSNKFICARYNPSAYLVNPEAFMKQYGEVFGEMNIQLSQRNLAMFIIPERARIVRKGQNEACAISFAKRGDNTLFAIAYPDVPQAKIVPADKVLDLFSADYEEKGYEYDEELDKKFQILRDEIRKPHPKIRLDKRKSEALDNLQQLLAICPAEKDYITDLIDVIKTYDDLSDGELKYLAALVVRKANAAELVVELKQKIPVHYIIQIKTRVEAIDSQAEIIMFTEDLRNDND